MIGIINVTDRITNVASMTINVTDRITNVFIRITIVTDSYVNSFWGYTRIVDENSTSRRNIEYFFSFKF